MTLSALRPSPRGFTLVEMLVVVAIMALLLGVSGLGIGKSISSMQLNASANALSATLNHAALLARKENRPVQLRFYKFALPESPTPYHRAYQLATLESIDASGNPRYRFLSEIHHLPSGIVMIDNTAYNTLAGLAEQPTGPSDPNFGPAYTCTSYEIRPDNLTTLPKDAPAAITLVLESQLTTPTVLPANYRTVVINTLNARTRIY